MSVHFEVLVEDSSGAALLEHLLPKILGSNGDEHTWTVHHYNGVGSIPKGLKPKTDAAKRILLDRLPKLLAGYGKALPGVPVVVVLDTDRRDCVAFLKDLKGVAAACDPAPRVLFRLAIEEVEAWYLGDRAAVLEAFPKAKRRVLDQYQQDSVCGTWELLADAVEPGGSQAILDEGWPRPGEVKHAWAHAIGPLLDVERNLSPSFCKLRDGLRGLVAENENKDERDAEGEDDTAPEVDDEEVA